MKISIETLLEGKVSLELSVTEDEKEGFTWIQLTKEFSKCLKALGYIPTKLDEFLDEEGND